eukprot:TRINITY_DN9178_c0_g1_i1.p1 TRINITY_DN9178_c0_g1~~TRINITY_DN9178_c0_g1_i1.p1  ORF type:complete len:621 (+),score=89.94 TRINITY_DN9178_c0_g1_i1:46-1908(+)
MPTPRPRLDVLCDDGDYEQAAKLRGLGDRLACGPKIEDADFCLSIVVEDGKAKKVYDRPSLRAPPDTDGIGEFVHERLLFHELNMQRSLLRRHVEDAFDAVERRLKSEFHTHRQPNGCTEAGTLPLDVCAAVGQSLAASPCDSPRGHTNLPEARQTTIESRFNTGDDESLEGHDLHHAPSSKRVARAMSDDSRAWDMFARKMMNAGGYNDGPEGWKWLAWLRGVTEHRTFELAFAILILLNTVNMSIEYQYKSLDVCYDIGFPNCKSPAKQIWHGADVVFHSIDLAFGFIFTLEVTIKLLSQHRDFFKSLWNYIDTFSLIGWYMVLFSDPNSMTNPMLMRLARVARLLRFLRLVKTIQMFDVLCLLIGSLRASCAILLWSSLLLVLIMCCTALISHTLMLGYINDESLPLDTRHEAYIVFGSFVRSFLTVHKLTFSLDTAAPEIIFELNEWFAIPLLLYQILVSFAVIKVIEAVFLNETIKLAATNDELVIMEKNRWESMQEEKVKALFYEADDSGDGYVDYPEFMVIMNDDKVISWLEAIDVEIDDPRLVWELLCNWNSGRGGSQDKLNVQSFVRGVGRLKGSAKSLDVLQLLREFGSLKVQMGLIGEALRHKTPATPH